MCTRAEVECVSGQIQAWKPYEPSRNLSQTAPYPGQAGRRSRRGQEGPYGARSEGQVVPRGDAAGREVPLRAYSRYRINPGY